MKKIAVVLVIAVLAVYAMPVFADCGTCDHDRHDSNGKSLFQIAADAINGINVPEGCGKASCSACGHNG